MTTASAGRADKGSSRGSRAFRAPLQRARLAVSGQGRGEANHRAKQPAPALKSEDADMNSYSEIEEPRTAAEIIARYRDVRRRLYSPATPPKLANSETRTDSAPCKAIAPIPGPSREPKPPPSETPFQHQTPAREALQAVSTRTCVPIADILGRNRRPPIAAARHEAVWRVRLATGWSLPRLGRFFKRDHTTVLHSLRNMEKRSARDPELLAYMNALSLPQIAAARLLQPPPISCSRRRTRTFA
jgi:Bacterial dnaA protein helix-turn-helix